VVSDLCQWEIDWVNAHPEKYEGVLHRTSVIRLITNRYELKAAQDNVVLFAKTAPNRAAVQALAMVELIHLTP